MAIFTKLQDYLGRTIRPFLGKYADSDFREIMCDASGFLKMVLVAGTAIVGWFKLKRVPVHTHTTGTGATLANLTPGAAFRLLAIRINISTGAPLAAAETLTVTLNSGTAAAYDTILYTLDMGTPSINDLVIPFGGEDDIFEAADVIDIVLSANAGGDTWGCETIHELV